MTKTPSASRTLPFRAAVVAALSAAVVVAALPVASAAPAAPTPGSPDGLQERVDRIVEAGAPGAALLVREGGDTVAVAAGLADVEGERELRPGDRFRVGSVTKSFLATLVLQLVDSGELALDATVADYLPRLVPAGDQITLRQLLNHTSGLFNYTEDPEFLERALAGEAFKPRELIAYSSSHDPLFPPGTDFSYSNTNYVVLGILARTAGEQSIRGQLDERITAPLQLDATSFPVRNKAVHGRHAHGYERDGELIDVTNHFSPTWAWAAGAIVSNPADITTFYAALLSGELVDPALLEEMMETVPAGEGVDFGLGLMAVELACGTFWGHGGDVPGYHAFVLGTADGARQVAVMVNIGAPRRVRNAVIGAIDATLCGGADSAELDASLLDSLSAWPAGDSLAREATVASPTGR